MPKKSQIPKAIRKYYIPKLYNLFVKGCAFKSQKMLRRNLIYIFSCKMKFKLIWILTFICFTDGKNIKSPKKGIVVSPWKNHMVGDFEAFSTISWWYNYHSYKEIYQEAPVWCHEPNGTIATNKTGCFPSDPSVEFVPMIWGEKGYGDKPGLVDDPDLTDDHYVFLG